MRKRQKRLVLSTKEQVIIGLSLVFLTLSLASILTVFFAMKPQIDAHHAAEQKALQVADLTQISSVETYQGKERDYAVYGQTAAGQKVAVLMDERGENHQVLLLSDGISKGKALDLAKEAGAKTGRVRLGRLDGQVIWEVADHTRYYLIDFKTGQLMKTEGI